MITIRKLKTLKSGTLRRKTAVLLQSFESELLEGRTVDRTYLRELAGVIQSVFPVSSDIPDRAETVLSMTDGISTEKLLRSINSLRHAILTELGAEPADWDFSEGRSPLVQSDDAEPASSAFCFEIFLDDIRSPFNVGSIFRTAEAFGVKKIFLSPDCPLPDHPRALRTSMGASEMVAWEVCSREECFSRAEAIKKPVFALELGGTSVSEFSFPVSGLAVIGSEELGISPEAREASAKSLGLLSIPIYGHKGSINVSSAFAIMMHRWAGAVAAC